MVAIGLDAKRKAEDMHLARYACYLWSRMPIPPKKTYFAVQTRRQELSDAGVLAEQTEQQRRLLLR